MSNERGGDVYSNHAMPRGWVEVQRDDELAVFETDEDFARSVSKRAAVVYWIDGEPRIYEGDELPPGRFDFHVFAIPIEDAKASGLLPPGACSECGEFMACKAPCLNTADSAEG